MRKRPSLLCIGISIFLCIACLAPTTVLAQQEPKAEDALQGAPQTDKEQPAGQLKDDQPTKAASTNANKEMHNPLANLKEVFFQTDILPNVGPEEKTTWSLSVEPLYPFDLGNDWRLVTYTIVPMISQPGLTPEAGRGFGLGDTSVLGYFVPPNEGKLIWGFGPALQIPTHTDSDLGNDKWAAGPALIVGVQPGNWSIWGLFDNQWSFAGSGEKINEFNLQYQVAYLLPKDWFLISNWIIEADWEAPSDDRWTVPIGGGFGRQFKIGKQQYQLYGQVGYNIVTPDQASTWRGIVTLTRVF